MKIAWIASDIPYPPNTGGKILVYNRISELHRRGHKIFLYAFASPQERKIGELQALHDICESVVIYRKRTTWQTLVRFFLTRSVPFRILRRPSDGLLRDLEACVEQRSIDIVQVESPVLAMPSSWQQGRRTCALFYDFISLEHQELARTAQHLSLGSPVRTLYQAEARRERAIVFEMLRQNPFDRYLFVSDTEREAIAAAFPLLEQRLIAVPIGINIANLSEIIPLSSHSLGKDSRKKLLFFGTFDNRANADAARWFVRAVFPRILRECPEAVFLVVGNKADKYVGDLQSGHVDVYSNVEGVKPYLAAADLCILPLRGGGGVRVKLLEAVAARKIIVTTSLGKDGTSFSSDRHLLVADTAEEFARRCVEALYFPERFEQMIEEAYALLKGRYSWQAVGDQLENLYRTTLESIRSSTGL